MPTGKPTFDSVRCIILGTDHKLQPSDSGLKQKVESLIRENGVSLIAEEVDADHLSQVKSVAKDIAEASRGQIAWLSIDMTSDQRRAAGIYDRLCIRPIPLLDLTTGLGSEQRVYLKHADGIREEFWLAQIKQAKPSNSVLIICGDMHVDFLADKAMGLGWRVTKDRYLPTGLGAYTFEVWD